MWEGNLSLTFDLLLPPVKPHIEPIWIINYKINYLKSDSREEWSQDESTDQTSTLSILYCCEYRGKGEEKKNPKKKFPILWSFIILLDTGSEIYRINKLIKKKDGNINIILS